MSKVHYFNNKFSKTPLTSDFGDHLKLSDLLKLWFFKRIITKSNIKKRLWRHCYCIT